MYTNIYPISPKGINPGAVGQTLYDAVKKVGDDFFEAQKKGRLPDWGTTLVAAFVDSNNHAVYVANIGDSRAMLVTREKDGSYKCQRLTTCHQPNKTDEYDRLSRLNPACLKTNDGYINGNIAISRSIGDYKKDPTGKLVTNEPEISMVSFDPNQETYLILGSDGIFSSAYLCELEVSYLFSQMRKIWPQGDLSRYIGLTFEVAVIQKYRLGKVSKLDNMCTQVMNVNRLRNIASGDNFLMMLDGHGNPVNVAGDILFESLEKQIKDDFNQLYTQESNRVDLITLKVESLMADLKQLKVALPIKAKVLHDAWDDLYEKLYNLMTSLVKESIPYHEMEQIMQSIIPKSAVGMVKKELIDGVSIIVNPKIEKLEKAKAIYSLMQAISLHLSSVPSICGSMMQFTAAAMALISDDPLMQICVGGEQLSRQTSLSYLGLISSPLHTSAPALSDTTFEGGYVVQPSLLA